MTEGSRGYFRASGLGFTVTGYMMLTGRIRIRIDYGPESDWMDWQELENHGVEWGERKKPQTLREAKTGVVAALSADDLPNLKVLLHYLPT